MPFQKGHKGFTPKLSEEHKRKLSEAHRGKVLSEEACRKISLAKRANPIRYWLGKNHSEETKAKIREARKRQVFTEQTKDKLRNRLKGEKNPNWKGGQPNCLGCGKKVSYNSKNRLCIKCFGISHKGEKSYLWRGGINEINSQIRKSEVYRRWRKAVFQRDNYTCQICGHRNSLKNRKDLQADHIKPFALYQDLRFKIFNGRTLCKECHQKTETYGAKFSKQKLNNGANSVEVQNG